jgi:hypothetical protein
MNMSIRRFSRRIKPLSEKGTPGTPMRRISIRIDPEGKRREWHPTKGWRQLVNARA